MYNFRAATDHFLRRWAAFEQNIASSKSPPFMPWCITITSFYFKIIFLLLNFSCCIIAAFNGE